MCMTTSTEPCSLLLYFYAVQVMVVNSQAAFAAVDATARPSLYKAQIAEVSAVLPCYANGKAATAHYTAS
jgi:hypothetical protein